MLKNLRMNPDGEKILISKKKNSETNTRSCDNWTKEIMAKEISEILYYLFYNKYIHFRFNNPAGHSKLWNLSRKGIYPLCDSTNIKSQIIELSYNNLIKKIAQNFFCNLLLTIRLYK